MKLKNYLTEETESHWISYKNKFYGPFKSYQAAKLRVYLGGLESKTNIQTYDVETLKYITDPANKGEEDYKSPKIFLAIDKFPLSVKLKNNGFFQSMAELYKVDLSLVLSPKELKKV